MDWPSFIAGIAFGGLASVLLVIWIALYYSDKAGGG